MSPGPPPPVVSVREGPSALRSVPSPEPRVPESPPETVGGGWLRNLSMAWRSSAPLFRAAPVSVDSTRLLMPAPRKVVQLEDQSPSNAPLIRISATTSPAPAARKSAVPLSP